MSCLATEVGLCESSSVPCTMYEAGTETTKYQLQFETLVCSLLSVSVLPVAAPTASSHAVNSPLSPSITPSLFHALLAQNLPLPQFSHYRLSLGFRTDSTGFMTGVFLLSIFFCFITLFFLFIGSMRLLKVAIRQLLGARKNVVSRRIISYL